MKAIGYTIGGIPITNYSSFQIFDLRKPQPQVGQVLVKVLAVSVNPVDTKNRLVSATYDQPQILGFDALGVIDSLGPDVTNFNIGDRVYYSYRGSNQEFQIVPIDVLAPAPRNFSDGQAVAMPLTSITAYEALFEKMRLTFKANANLGKSILIINGAGGVGSIAIQLAKWAGLKVYATYGRPETHDWISDMGTDHTIDHHGDIIGQVHEHTQYVDHILILHRTEDYFDISAELIKPLGHIVSVVESFEDLPLGHLKDKAVSFDWEFMLAKAKYHIDLASQGLALQAMTSLFESGDLVSTMTQNDETGINSESLRLAHEAIERGKAIGKCVITGGFTA
jgi:zinc-binding alcohol dehydrogenase family protein